MKKANILVVLIGGFACFIAATCLAQSFMNYGGTADTSSNGTPRLTANGQIMPLSADDFKNKVTTLGRKNQEKLAQQVQSMLPPPGSNASNTASTAAASTTSQPASSSSSSMNSQSMTATPPPAQRNTYSGFGASGSAPASSSGSSGFGIKY